MKFNLTTKPFKGQDGDVYAEISGWPGEWAEMSFEDLVHLQNEIKLISDNWGNKIIEGKVIQEVDCEN